MTEIVSLPSSLAPFAVHKHLMAPRRFKRSAGHSSTAVMVYLEPVTKMDRRAQGCQNARATFSIARLVRIDEGIHLLLRDGARYGTRSWLLSRTAGAKIESANVEIPLLTDSSIVSWELAGIRQLERIFEILVVPSMICIEIMKLQNTWNCQQYAALWPTEWCGCDSCDTGASCKCKKATYDVFTNR